MKRSKGNHTQRICAFLLSLAMVLTMLPAQILPASAAGEALNTTGSAVVRDVSEEYSLQQKLERLAAQANPEQLTDADLPDPEEEVRVIIELDTESLIETWERDNLADTMTITDFLTTDAASEQLEAMTSLQSQVLNQMQKAGIDTKMEYSYTTVASGFSAVVPYGQIETIEAMNGVRRVLRSEKWYPDVLDSETQAAQLQAAMDFANNTDFQGQGIVIGILDTGLDWTHEAFVNAPESPRLAKKDLEKLLYSTDSAGNLLAHSYAALWTANYLGYKLTADDLYMSAKVPFAFDYADTDTNVIPSQDAVTYFGNDHGTHVAGTAAGKAVDETGNVTFSGEAPEAQLAIFKVFSDYSGGAYTDIILAALNDAVVLGVDVVNMSLGSSGGFAEEEPGSSLDNYYSAVEAAGILLNCSAGNSYSSTYSTNLGDYALTSNPDNGIVGSASSYEAALSVASINSGAQSFFTAGEQTISYQNVDGRDFAAELLDGQQSVQLPYVLVPNIGSAEDFEGLDVTGKIAVIQRGSLSFEDKQLNAAAAGAIGCLIYNNKDGYLMNMSVTDCRIPTAAISLPDGQLLAEMENKTLTLEAGTQGHVTMSDFSSWGPLPGLELKPEITAPGGDIYSTLPFDNSYGYMSGTSMASPYMAGAAAVMAQYVKKLYPGMSAADRRILVNRLAMSTAQIVLDETHGGVPYSPRKQGAGLVDLEAALQSPAFLYVRNVPKAKLELGDDPLKTGEYILEFHIQNMTSLPLTYAVDTLVQTEQVTSDGKFIAQAGYPLSADTSRISVAGGSLENDKITVPANGDTTVTITVVLSDEDRTYLDTNFENGIYVEGFVTLTAAEAPQLSIPFLAFYGDWTQAPILDADDFGDEEAAVYATKVAGLLGNTYLFNLGHYLFNLPEGVEEPAPSKEKIALTMGSGSGIDTLYYLQGGLLRGAKEVNITISDRDTDEIYAAGSGINFRKSYYYPSTGSVLPTDLGGTFRIELANNEKLRYSLEAFVDADGPQNNRKSTFDFDFTVDSEAPKLMNQEELAFYQGEDGRTYLDLVLTDNHYLMAATLASALRAGTSSYLMGDTYYEYLTPCVHDDGADVLPEELFTMTFDVTDFYDKLIDDYFYVIIYDYALNETVLQVQMPTFVQAEAVSLEESEVTIKTNEIKQLHATILPENATTQELMWSSSNLQVVRVQNGEITGMKPGTVTITARPASNQKLAATCTVTVTDEALDPIPMESFQLNESEKTLEIGQTFSLRLNSYLPYNASSTNVTWSSSAEDIATVNEYGTVRAVSTGQAVITAKAAYGEAIATCQITVPEADGVFVMEGTTLVKYNGSEAVVQVPDGITAVANRAFASNPSIQEVYFPSSLRTIGESAFNSCVNLKTVTFPEYMTSWGDYLFQGCTALTSVNIPQGLTAIPTSCFRNCSALGNVTIPDTVQTVGSYAFYGCKAMTRIDLPDSVTTLDVKGYQWYNCSGVTELNLSAGLSEIPLSCFSGLICLTEFPDLKNITVLGDSCFLNMDSVTSVTLSATVEKLGYMVFGNSDNLTSVHFAGSPEQPGTSLFSGCKALTSVTGNLTAFGSQWFNGCTSLTQFVVPDHVTYIGDNAFKGCTSLTGLTFTADSEMTGGHAFGSTPFYGCTKMTGFTVEEGNPNLTVDAATHALYSENGTILMAFPYINYGSNILETTKVIGSYTFSQRTGLSAVTIPDSVEVICDHAFYGLKNLKSITLPDGLVTLEDNAFNGCTGATEINLGQSLVDIGKSAFTNCSKVTSLNFPDTVRVIGDNAFNGCQAATVISLPEGLESIGARAFNNCKKVAEIRIPSTVTQIGEYAFYSCAAATTIDCGSLTSIPQYAFYGCTMLADLQLSDAVTEIGSRAFYNCRALNLSAWPSQLTTVGTYAFYGCWSQKNLDFSGTCLETIGGSAFYQAYAAESLIFPETLVSLGDSAFRYMNDKYQSYGCAAPVTDVYLGAKVQLSKTTFQNCPYLKNIFVDGENPWYASSGGLLLERETGAIVIWPIANETSEFTFPDTITQIPAFQFQNNQLLKKVVIPGNVTLVAYGAFQDSAIEEVIFEDSYTTCLIDSDAFAGCTALSSIRLPNGLTGIGYRAFDGCTALETVTLPDTLVSVVDYTFRGCTELREVKLSAGLTALSLGMFAGCTSLEELYLPAGVSSIGIPESSTGFAACSGLKNIYVDSASRNFKSVDGVLYDYNGKTLRLYPAGRTETTYCIPEGVTRVGAWAFAGNAGLEKVSLPSSLIRVGNCAFYGCPNLTTYIFYGQTAPLLETISFYGNFTGMYKDYGKREDGTYGYIYQDLGLTMYRPQNSTGYDTDVWMGFFGTENGQIIEMEPSLFTVLNLTAAEGENRTAELTWTEPGQTEIESVTYTVERALAVYTESNGQETWIYDDFQTLAQNLTDCAYTDETALSFGLTYAYRVTAYNAAGETGPAAVTTLCLPADPDNADELAALAVIQAIEALKPIDQLKETDTERVQNARAMYDALTEAQKALVPNYPTLAAALSQVAAAQVMAQIAQLPGAVEITLDDAEAVAAARKAYEALTEEEKALVSNLFWLEAAEAALLQAAAAQVEAQIARLPEPEAVTSDDAEAIAAARKAYDALTEEEKALVSNLAYLEAAEKALQAAQSAAQVEAQIALLPDAEEIALEDAEAIAAARAAYDALSDEEKARVSNLAWLEAAEAALAQKRQEQAEKDAIASRFTDIQNHWAHDEIVEAVWRGLFTGMTDTIFAPETSMTRGMFVTVLWRAAGEPEAETAASFPDVDSQRYYAKAVNWAVEAGIAKGISADRFSPNSPVTREQLATFLYRFAQVQGITLEKAETFGSFSDAQLIHPYAAEAMTWAVEAGLLRGYPNGTLQPRTTATRAQVAVILVRFQDAETN